VAEVQQQATAFRSDYPEPLWIQALQLIRAEIDEGALQPGMRLPPERELCQQLNISRMTLRKALNQLVEDGVLNSSHGRGWYVAKAPAAEREWPSNLESFSETAARMGLTASSRVLAAEARPANLDEAEDLGIAPGTPLFRLERVRLLDGVPIALDLTRIAASLVPDLGEHDFSTESFYDSLAAAGVEPTRANSTIEAREADAYTAAQLNLAVGKPVLVMHQVAVDGADRPLFTSVISYVGERYRLRTSFARSTHGW
jgi:DNA-binding GntR family transcriptional regulator